MKRLHIVAALACCILAFGLAGCSGASKSTASEDLKGFWEIDPSSSIGFDAALNLDEDDFAELIVADSYLEGSWKADGSQATIEFSDGMQDQEFEELELDEGLEGSSSSASTEASSASADASSASATESESDAAVKKADIYVSGDKLYLGTDDGSRLVFIKSDIDTYYGDESEEIDLDANGEAVGDNTTVVDEVIEDVSPVAIADDKICKIEVTGKGTDFTADPGYRLSITNNTDKTLFLGADDLFKINGQEIEAGFGEIVDPGDTVETFMYFSASDVGGGADKLVGVEGTIVVSDDDTGDELGSYPFKMD